MQRTPAMTLVLGLLALLPSCASQDKAIFDDLDARAASGQRSALPAAPSADPEAGWTQSGIQSGTSSGAQVAAIEAGMPIAMTGPLLPRNAAAAPEVAGLDFLTGRWVAVNPNKTVNEEIWSKPRGNTLVGTFRQIRLDGDCSLIELSQISIEGEEIVLRLRHLHGRLEVPEGQGEISRFRLVSHVKDRVEFTGATGAESVTSMVYERTSPMELIQTVTFSPESGQEGFSTHYYLDR